MSILRKEDVLDMVLRSISGNHVPSRENVEEMVSNFLKAFTHLVNDRDWLVREALEILVTGIDRAEELVDPDPTGYIPWLTGQDQSEWRSWPWLKLYLKERLRRPKAVMDELDRSTDRVLDLLADPKREGLWDRRGMVVGHVQSGKTQHYTALVAKALDAGYKIIIILSGIHENLRQQTQERIEECITGKNSRERFQHFGVRLFSSHCVTSDKPSHGMLDVSSLTSVAGDYGKAINEVVDVALGTVPVVFVVKKNVSILTNLLGKLRGKKAPYSPLRWPTLVIDDEADHSSVNTAKIDPDTDPTRINELIRKILWCCDKVAFVGYTATPYANIFIQDELTHKDGIRIIDSPGSDLFPRAFIIGLKAPSNYIGPDVVFGHDGDEAMGIPSVSSLPMHVEVDDADGWLPPKHKRDFTVSADLPDSLSDSLKTFLISIAARMALGQDTDHCSMLLHVTRFTAVQAQVMAQVRAYMEWLSAELESSQSREVTHNSLRNIWETQFVDKFQHFEIHPSQSLIPPQLPDWTDVEQKIITAFTRLSYAMINSETKEDLDFAANKDGLVVLAVGGDRLSRGLTLEGLSVSYFLRGARAYDTLMQMGRWFGYRPGYAHLCRVFAPEGIVSNFKTIVLATEELRREFGRMSYLKKTPSDYGLQVREPRADLMVTAMNKMRRGETVRIHFAESLISSLDIAEQSLESNFNAFADLVQTLQLKMGSSSPEKANHIWREVEWELLIPFFLTYNANLNLCLDNSPTRKSLLMNYIEKVHSKGDLVRWTVVVVGSGKGKEVIGSMPFRTVGRKRLLHPKGPPRPLHAGRINFNGVAMGSDEGLDLPVTARGNADEVCNAAAYRAARPSSHGLLLLYPIIPTLAAHAKDHKMGDGEDAKPVIGIAVSLPNSKHDNGMDYVCNSQKRREMFGPIYEDLERDDQEDAEALRDQNR